MENLTMEHKAQEIVFTGRKPSKAQILSKIKPLAALGSTLIEVYWGENGITLDKTSGHGWNIGPWYGYGWIKDISAESIALELNQGAKK
jgi:hypothetical protein